MKKFIPIKWILILLFLMLTTHLMYAQNINRIEYFIDVDPGFGNGLPVSFSQTSNVIDLSFNVNLSAVSEGLHQLFTRSRNNNGWSITANKAFVKTMLQNRNIQKIEYFVGADPGFGNATTVNTPVLQNVPNIAFDVDLSAVPNGFNHFFVRSFDGTSWSISSQFIFVKGIINTGNINAIEYFIGTDPGFGNATPVTITPSSNINELVFSVNTSSLANGEYELFVRSRESTGNWSITAVVPFTKGSVLPVQLLNFEVSAASNKKALLQWQTSNEINNKKFVVEHATNAVFFQPIGEVPAATGSGNLHSYSFVHDGAGNHLINYYRLKQVDIDESFQYSPVKVVRFNPDATPGISVYPTLIQQHVLVKNVPLKSSISIFDATGKKLFSVLATTNSTNINLADVKAGTYILVVHDQGKLLASQKLVKL